MPPGETWLCPPVTKPLVAGLAGVRLCCPQPYQSELWAYLRFGPCPDLISNLRPRPRRGSAQLPGFSGETQSCSVWLCFKNVFKTMLIRTERRIPDNSLLFTAVPCPSAPDGSPATLDDAGAGGSGKQFIHFSAEQSPRRPARSSPYCSQQPMTLNLKLEVIPPGRMQSSGCLGAGGGGWIVVGNTLEG